MIWNLCFCTEARSWPSCCRNLRRTHSARSSQQSEVQLGSYARHTVWRRCAGFGLLS
jgi:hypothetical protein